MILQAKNLTVKLVGSDRELIRGFSYALSAGDKTAIIGEEGDGKSTLLKLLCDRDSVSSYASFEGELLQKGVFGYLPQFLPAEEGEKTVAAYFDGEDVFSLYEIIETFSLDFDFFSSEQRMKDLSGGEKVKAQLIKLLCRHPDALFLDEPTNDLDLDALLFLEEFIQHTPLPVMFVSHDETFLERTANTVIHLEQLIKKTACQVTVCRLPYLEYLSGRELSFERQTRIARKEQSEWKKQRERWQQIYEKTKSAQNNISRGDPHGGRLLKKKMKSLISQERRLDRTKEKMTRLPDREESIITRFPPTLSLPPQKRVLNFHLSELKVGEKLLSEGVDLTVYGNRHVCIVGKNGAGKSTLLKRLWAELRERTDVTAAYMPQAYDEVLPPELSPEEFLGGYDKQTRTRAMTYLGNMKFTADEMRQPTSRLSGGQRAKLIFLNMVLAGADVLLLDEPTRNFSPLSAPVVRKALREFNGCIIAVSHDRKYINEAADEIYLLDETGLHPVGEE